jgi:hypothetical protein
VLVELDEVGGVVAVVGGVVAVVVVLVFVVFSFTTGVAAGLTTVVLLSAGGLTVSLFCSQAARSVALAKMQSSFFIIRFWLPILDKPDSQDVTRSALPKITLIPARPAARKADHAPRPPQRK